MTDYAYAQLEDLVLSKILITGTIPTFLLDKVGNAWWSTTERRQAWWAIKNHYQKYGVTPKPETFSKFLHTWTYDPTLDPSEPWDFYIDRFVERQVYWQFEEVTDKVGDKIGNASFEAAAMSEVVEVLNSFVTASQGLQASTTMADAYNKSFFWDERMEWYEHGRSPTEEGIRCGFSHIDTATHGIVPGQLWTLFAPPKSYKTSALCYMAAHFQKQDKRVLFVSFEMTHQEVLERIDAIHAGVSLSKIRDGALDKAEVEAIRDATSILSSMYVQSGHQHDTVGGVQGLIGDVDPDIVIIDGAYFIRDPESNERGTPRALTNVTRDLKRVASVAGKPILISTQALSWKMNKKAKLAHESIGYSSSFSQDSDLVVGMRRVEDASGMPGKADLVEMDIVLSRNGPLMQASLEWKWSEGRWSYVGVEDDDEDEDDDS